MTVLSMHAHLDHDNCIETVILRGRTEAVLAFAETVKAQSGAHLGTFHLIPIDIGDAKPHT